MIEGGAGALIKPPLASTALENSVTQAGCFFISAGIFRLAVWTVHWVPSLLVTEYYPI
jgi:hypothetical protein